MVTYKILPKYHYYIVVNANNDFVCSCDNYTEAVEEIAILISEQ